MASRPGGHADESIHMISEEQLELIRLWANNEVLMATEGVAEANDGR